MRLLRFLILGSLTLLCACVVVVAASEAAITVDAPPSLSGAADRVRAVDASRLRQDLERAGLLLPSDVRITLIPDTDPRAAHVPVWIVGLAAGTDDIVIFPDRVLSYPYDSLESVVRHEVAHLALSRRAGGQPLPRWFHEGAAVSVDAESDMSSRLQLLLAMRTDPGMTDLRRLFGSGNQPDSSLAYRLSAALVDDLRRRHGADTPGAIAARVAEGVPFERAFTLETGQTPDEAAADAWSSYRRWTAWVSALTGPSMPWAIILMLAFVAFLVGQRRRTRRRRLWDEEDSRRSAEPE